MLSSAQPSRGVLHSTGTVALWYVITMVRDLLRAQGRQPLPWSFHQPQWPEDVRPFSRPHMKPRTRQRCLLEDIRHG